MMMACCGVQFALMSYIGTMWGLIVGIFLCLGVFSVVLVVGIAIATGNPSKSVNRLDNLAIQLTLAIVILFISVIFAGGGMAIYQVVIQTRLKSQLQHDLGVSFDTTYVRKEQGFEPALEVNSVTPGGLAEQAGFQTGDVIVSDSQPREYLRILDENRGSEINVTLAAVSGNQPVDKAPQRQVTVMIPLR